jgi:hypothetical protein
MGERPRRDYRKRQRVQLWDNPFNRGNGELQRLTGNRARFQLQGAFRTINSTDSTQQMKYE